MRARYVNRRLAKRQNRAHTHTIWWMHLRQFHAFNYFRFWKKAKKNIIFPFLASTKLTLFRSWLLTCSSTLMDSQRHFFPFHKIYSFINRDVLFEYIVFFINQEFQVSVGFARHCFFLIKIARTFQNSFRNNQAFRRQQKRDIYLSHRLFYPFIEYSPLFIE